MVDVDLTVKDTAPLHGSVELNNRYSANTTPLRTNATVSYDNLWQLGHSLSLTYQVAPENPDDAQVFSGSYLARVPNLPWLSFLLYGLKSDSNVATLGSINVAGKGDVIGLRAVMTLPTVRETGFYHSLSLGLDYKHFDENVQLSGSTSDTPIDYYPFVATYSGTLQDKNSVTQFDAGITFGVDGMGSSPAQFDNKGFKTAPNYIYFRGDLSRTQELPLFGLQGYGKIQGQVADEALVNSEQFSGGGLDSIRGYLESEALGDNAAVGQFELRTPDLGKWIGTPVNEWRFYVFGDAGWLTINDPLPEVVTNYELASVGVGTRIKLLDHLSGSLDMAAPLLKGPNTKADGIDFTFKVAADF
jgi:hemolysin activation/secretion protein